MALEMEILEMKRDTEFEFEPPKRTKKTDESDDEDLDLDILGGRGQRHGAVTNAYSDEEDDDEEEKESKTVEEHKFSIHREYEESKGVDEYDENGTKIDAFNLDEEMEQGYFDDAGMYVEKKDQNKDKDNWLQGITREDIQKAKLAKEKREKKNKETEAPKISIEELYKKLFELVEPGQSIPKAMKAFKKKKQKEKLDLMTDICSQFIDKGIYSIYEETYESLEEKVNS
ncbi:hypothetical protein ROZALSC1DRAFT_26441 [Rozella allomycis CSF55]|uniref:Uncharacterized protein n=1 Tax=Rozella allomycis (strain CSF55) TaxID=988480 RepID=A0A4P9YTP2_ROZAC|nr:hypothetical protein ROZALSC1DRAFT_26441 [Rozella allomycis CSF55]